jgi:hypothetical protein
MPTTHVRQRVPALGKLGHRGDVVLVDERGTGENLLTTTEGVAVGRDAPPHPVLVKRFK